MPTSFYIFILAGSQLLYRITIINTLFISFSLFPEKQTHSDNFPVFPTPQTAVAESFNPKPTHPQDPRFTSPLIPTSLSLSLTSFLFQSTSSFSNSLALIDADFDETLTFHQLKLQVSKLAHSLLLLNIHKNDVILIVAPNSIHFPPSVSFPSSLSAPLLQPVILLILSPRSQSKSKTEIPSS